VFLGLGLYGAGRSIVQTFQDFGSDLDLVTLLFSYGFGLQGVLYAIGLFIIDACVVLQIVYLAQLAMKKNGFFFLFILTSILGRIGSVLMFIVTLMLAPGDPSLVFYCIIIALALVQLVLFTIYFLRSVRVRTYMGSAGYILDNPFTRWSFPPQPAVPDEPLKR
jgi:hypothetical protein